MVWLYAWYVPFKDICGKYWYIYGAIYHTRQTGHSRPPSLLNKGNLNLRNKTQVRLHKVLSMMTSSNGNFSALLVLGVENSSVNSPLKVQWCRAVMLSLIYALTNSWSNSLDAGDLRRHRANYDITVMRDIQNRSHAYKSNNLILTNTLYTKFQQSVINKLWLYTLFALWLLYIYV